MVILSVCTAMTMAACGGNTDTAKVEETAVTEESAEADVQAETEATEETVSEPVEEEAVEEDEEEQEEESTSEAFYEISSQVAEEDKSDEYGVYSTSCYDLDQFLDENKEAPEEWSELNENGDCEYSGRFAYPELTECDAFKDATLAAKTDRACNYMFGDGSQLAISPGHRSFNSTRQLVDGIVSLSVIGTVQPGGEESELIHDYQEFGLINSEEGYSINDEGDYIDADGNIVSEEEASSIYSSHVYTFKLGNFSIDYVYEAGEDEILSAEEIQKIVDNIHLIGEAAE